jgi:hypothetical protein
MSAPVRKIDVGSGPPARFEGEGIMVVPSRLTGSKGDSVMKNVFTGSDMDSSVKAGEQLRFDDLAPQDVELSEVEIRAVSGGRGGQLADGSWTSGSVHRTDEWVLQ